jgi:LmbE family N-acetylglucosaminyl deacetylase
MDSRSLKPVTCETLVRYQDHLAIRWIRSCAPLRWHGNVDLRFRLVGYSQLEAAGNWRNPDVVAKWMRKLTTGQPIPPLIVCKTERNTFYLRDGNHRHEALHRAFGSVAANFPVRVVEVVPKFGFHFRYRWYRKYGTYVFEPTNLSRFSPRLVPLHVVSRSESSCCVSHDHLDESSPLFGRVLAVLAHTDDETVCAALLHRAEAAEIAFCTDGAPRSEFFWRRYGSRESYAAVRRREACRALQIIGVTTMRFLRNPVTRQLFRDQELYRDLSHALDALLLVTTQTPPDAIVTPAYEGGHPDHDACSFLAHQLGLARQIPVWEMPLYHRSQDGPLIHQQFLNNSGTEILLQLTPAELSMRERMLTTYASQPDAADFVSASVERFRPQTPYDYSRPPHPGQLNYEVWDWPMTATEVCRAFQACSADASTKRKTGLSNTVETMKRIDTHSAVVSTLNDQVALIERGQRATGYNHRKPVWVVIRLHR